MMPSQIQLLLLLERSEAVQLMPASLADFGYSAADETE